MDKSIVDAVSYSGPRYNDYLLRGFQSDQISQAADFIGTVFGEAIKLFNGVITYTGHRVLSPEKRAEYELVRNGGCRISVSELLLVEYVFAYSGKEYTIPLYIPYLKNDVIVIEDTNYVLQRSIKEQVASRTTSGITMKVIRQPIPFYRTASYRLESASDDWISNESVPTTSIHRLPRTNRRKMIDASVVHYLLCKFGFLGTLARFNLTAEDCVFVTEIAGDVDEFRYFPAKKSKKKKQVDLFLKVRTTRLEDKAISKLIANILYTVTAFQKHQMEDLYEPTGAVFRIMLGKIINGNGINEIQSKNKIDTHIASLDTYLDPITRDRLHEYGIEVNDIYDLLQYVFVEINQIVRNTSHTNLYNSRIDYLEELLVETIVKSIYLKWYNAETDPKKLNHNEVEKSILRFPRDLITKLHTSRIVQKNPPAYGDNALVGWLIQKIRQSGLSNSGRIIRSPDHRFHPSMAVVESLISFSKSNPGAGGAINPYLEITRKNGSVIRPECAADIDVIGDYLPYS